MSKAVDEEDYKTFFEYRMNQYSKTGRVGRNNKVNCRIWRRNIFNGCRQTVPMIEDTLKEQIPSFDKNKQMK